MLQYKEYTALKEQAYWHILPSGLTVAVVKRPGFSRKLAYLVTDFGSIHTDFTLDGEQICAPAGVAHYLEHKLFDMPGRDISEEFAALGAVPNAFTSYDMTAYYFSCTENFQKSLSLLLEFVFTPYFTRKSVQKEQGIIGQEIDMNEDSPDTRVFENLMQAMYRNHPVRIPILGTRQTIAEITPQVLLQNHKAFYNPANMLLCVVGDVDAQQVCQIAQQQLKGIATPDVESLRSWDEEMTCPQSKIQCKMEIAMPTFQMGFKCEPLGRGESAVREEIIGDLAAEVLFGESSQLYLQMYEQGLIDSSFGGGFETIEGMAMLTASGDSDYPEKVMEAILNQAEQTVLQPIPQEDFLRMKRSALGRRIRSLDSFDSTAFRVCAYYFSGFDYFDFPQVCQSVEEHEVREFIRRVVTRQRCGLSVVEPC